MVSVIIPVYNREKTVKKSIMSVLNQTYTDFELIIVDDASTDNSINVIREIQDDRIRIICHENNKGASAARNMGIDAAKGEYIAFNDSDDLWRENKLEFQMEALLKNDVDICFCQMERNNYQNVNRIHPTISEGIVDAKLLMMESLCSTQTMICKKHVFDKYRFDETLPRWLDYDFVIRSSVDFKFYFLKKILVDVYLQDNSITSNEDNKQLEIFELFVDRHRYLFKEHKDYAQMVLANLAFRRFMAGYNPTRVYFELFTYDKKLSSFFKGFLSATGLLNIIWKNKR